MAASLRAGVGVHVDVEGPDVVGQHRLVYRDVTGQGDKGLY